VHTGLLLQRYRSGDFAHVYPLARVAALRETSILFGAVIGVLLFRERFGPWWLAGAAVTVAGVLLLTAS
jgi:drug/metabolite transporter (DMT)-like permease